MIRSLECSPHRGRTGRCSLKRRLFRCYRHATCNSWVRYSLDSRLVCHSASILSLEWRLGLRADEISGRLGQTYTILLSASSVVPSNWGIASSASCVHGVVVIQIHTFALIGETILSVGTGQVLYDSLRSRKRLVYILQ